MRSIFAARAACATTSAINMTSAMMLRATPTEPAFFSRHIHGLACARRQRGNIEANSGNVAFQRVVWNSRWHPLIPMMHHATTTMNFYSMNRPTSEKQSSEGVIASVEEEKPKTGLIAQFKDLYKRYWYVLVPVHVVTSTGWMVAFYYLSKSGVDVPELLRSIDVSDSFVSGFEQSKMGHWAIAYLCYKIATPVRYAVTVGGTTISIKFLSQWGYIKPMPSNERLREMYADQKAKVKAGYADMQNKVADARTSVSRKEAPSSETQKK